MNFLTEFSKLTANIPNAVLVKELGVTSTTIELWKMVDRSSLKGTFVPPEPIANVIIDTVKKIEKKRKEKIQFEIQINVTSVLSANDLWPDGDMPENPDVQDVYALIQRDGGVDIINDWNLAEDAEILVIEK